MTRDEFMALGIDPGRSLINIRLKGGRPSLEIAKLREPVLESQPAKLLFYYYVGEDRPGDPLGEYWGTLRWVEASVDLELVKSITILWPMARKKYSRN